MGGDETLWANAWAREARNEAVWIPRVPFGKRIPEPRNGVLKGAEAFALEPKPSINVENQEKRKRCVMPKWLELDGSRGFPLGDG